MKGGYLVEAEGSFSFQFLRMLNIILGLKGGIGVYLDDIEEFLEERSGGRITIVPMWETSIILQKQSEDF